MNTLPHTSFKKWKEEATKHGVTRFELVRDSGGNLHTRAWTADGDDIGYFSHEMPDKFNEKMACRTPTNDSGMGELNIEA